MNISKVSERLADIISTELNYSEEKKEIIAYGVESIFLTVIGFIAVLLLALPFKAVFPAAMAAVSGGLLRKVSGGAHFNSPFKCLFFGAIIYSSLGVIANKILQYNLYNIGVFLVVLVISLVIVAILAPIDCEAKPIHCPSFRQKLKIASLCFVVLTCMVILVSNNTLLNISVVLGIVYQTMTLLPIFNKKKKEVSV